ncbi:MAG: hypothetical protein JWR38_2499 [Mucilaginibacter sp.]|nr:hypothetical protein [Mucilaginibacter sp.]
MKKALLLIVPVFLLFSCKKDNNVPRTETTTKGSKWNLKIGSSYSDTYAQLQQLGKEKNIPDVAVVKPQPISKLEEIEHSLAFYNAISIETANSTGDQVVFQFREDKISSIQTGGVATAEVTKWPRNVPDNVAVKKDDPVSGLYAKLQSIYQMPAYQASYRIILPDKPLDKAFAPNMASSGNWLFYFFVDVKPGKTGRYTVNLFFKGGKLNKISAEYNEFDVYN